MRVIEFRLRTGHRPSILPFRENGRVAGVLAKVISRHPLHNPPREAYTVDVNILGPVVLMVAGCVLTLLKIVSTLLEIRQKTDRNRA